MRLVGLAGPSVNPETSSEKNMPMTDCSYCMKEMYEQCKINPVLCLSLGKAYILHDVCITGL